MRGQTLLGETTRQFPTGTSWAWHWWGFKETPTYGYETVPAEEFATVGLGGYNNRVNGKAITIISSPGAPTYTVTGNVAENDIRREQGLAVRTHYKNFR